MFPLQSFPFRFISQFSFLSEFLSIQNDDLYICIIHHHLLRVNLDSRYVAKSLCIKSIKKVLFKILKMVLLYNETR